MRLVVDLIRGKSVNEAVAILKFSKKHAAKQISKVLLSAVANAEQREPHLDHDALFVKTATVDPGPMLKRWMPAAMGRATPLKKRTSHVHIIVATRE